MLRVNQAAALKRQARGIRLTEISNEVRLLGIGCPLAIGDVIILVHVEAKNVSALSTYWLAYRYN